MKTIDEAIFVASPETIVKRRYNPLCGILITAVSTVALWANSNIEWFELHEAAAQWNFLISSCLFCTGVTMICYWLFGDSSAPFERQTRQRMYRTEFTFEATDYPRIRAAFEAGDFSIMRSLPKSYAPAVQVICYSTDSGSLAVAQLLRQQQPECDMRIFHQGEFAI